MIDFPLLFKVLTSWQILIVLCFFLLVFPIIFAVSSLDKKPIRFQYIQQELKKAGKPKQKTRSSKNAVKPKTDEEEDLPSPREKNRQDKKPKEAPAEDRQQKSAVDKKKTETQDTAEKKKTEVQSPSGSTEEPTEEQE